MVAMTLGERFARDGVVRVEGAIPADQVAAMRACVLARIADLAFVEIAGARRPARGTELAMWEIGRDPVFASLPGALADATARVFGPGVWTPVAGELGGVAMPNLPCPGATWRACDVAWHVDEPTPPGGEPGGILLGYALLDVVEPHGGGTTVIAGSHRRLAALADAGAAPITYEAAREAFAAAVPWFAALLGPAPEAALAAGCESAGVPLRVVEVTGGPGDLVLLDPRCLHTIAANVSARPRLAMRLTCLRTGT